MRLAALSLAVLALSALSAEPATLTIVTNLPLGGTVSGGGQYTAGAAPAIDIQAFRGYYVKDVSAKFLWTPAPSWSPLDLWNQQIAVDINTFLGSVADWTIITNDTETLPGLNGDAMVTVTFDSCYPRILEQPKDQILLGGTNAQLRGTAFGRQPYTFQWWKDGVPIPGATNAFVSTTISDSLSSILSLTNLSTANSGQYFFSVSNIFGVSNSAPANFVVKDILFTVDGQQIVASNANVGVQNAISIQSRFPNGSIFYTLDGSQPDFGSTPYAGPFSVSQNATVRAVAYSADFSQSVLSEPLEISIVPVYGLTTIFGAGGYALLDPPGPFYLSNAVVTVSPVAYPGWTFMSWDGDLFSGTATNTIVMDRSKVIRPTFGTTLSATTAGNGSVSISPSFPLYPAGTLVTFTAMPAASNYFALWGNAGSGSVNPFQLAVGNPTQTVSALFAPLQAGQVTLTVLSEGGGSTKTATAWTNRYALGITNVITATPFGEQRFLGWSGDATGTNREVEIIMDSSKVITAHFTHSMSLTLDTFLPLELSCFGVEGDLLEFQASTNAVDWVPLATITNFTGRATYSDQESPHFPYRIYRAVRR
ncbi:MAG TPA: FN3 associated domain-containing protein [Verrucomicrobiae bacterium]|nr:FN3 associated domain-containing protein [Verrucomicrobiae bacterium]